MDTAQEQVPVTQQLVDAAADLLGAVALLGVDLSADNVHHHVGHHAVRHQQRHDGDGGKVQPEQRQLFDQPEVHRVDPHHDHHAGQTEQHQIADPHPAVQVHGLLAIVPPAGMERLLHVPADEVLQSAADEKARQKDFARRAAPDAHKAAHQHRHQHHAAAVNGAVGADEEATVDEPVVLDVFQRDLHHPAQHGEHKVQHDQLAQQRPVHKGHLTRQQ